MGTPKETLIGAVELAESEVRCGAMTQRDFNKVAVVIAWELIRDHGDLDALLVVINKVPKDYFDLEVWEDVVSDATFSESILGIGDLLNRYGALIEQPVNMAMGEA